jgi:hypothetical protein
VVWTGEGEDGLVTSDLDENAPGLRGPNAVDAPRGPNVVDGLRGAHAVVPSHA